MEKWILRSRRLHAAVQPLLQLVAEHFGYDPSVGMPLLDGVLDNLFLLIGSSMAFWTFLRPDGATLRAVPKVAGAAGFLLPALLAPIVAALGLLISACAASHPATAAVRSGSESTLQVSPSLLAWQEARARSVDAEEASHVWLRFVVARSAKGDANAQQATGAAVTLLEHLERGATIRAAVDGALARGIEPEDLDAQTRALERNLARVQLQHLIGVAATQPALDAALAEQDAAVRRDGQDGDGARAAPGE